MMSDWLLLPVAPSLAMSLAWALTGAALVAWGWPRVATPYAEARLSRRIQGQRWLLGCVLAGVALLAVWPRPGWSGYAALTFQSPSLVSMVWSVLVLTQVMGRSRPARASCPTPIIVWALLCLLGWGLVVDTLNLWPRAWDPGLYAWGFSSGALWFSALLLMALAWWCPGIWVWQALGVVAAYVVLRWPSGNLWDAWLDPAVWVYAHLQVARAGWRCMRAQSTR
jgi:hypothetical protein